MPNPRRLPNGSWGCRVDGPLHPNGQRNQIRVVEDTRAEALARVHEIEGQRLTHARVAKRGPTLLDFGTSWLDDHLPNVAETTARRYQGIVDNHIAGDPIASIRIGDLTAQDCREWLTRLRQKPGRSTARLSNRSLLQNLAVLNLILKTAVEWGEVDSNPLFNVERPRIRKDTTKVQYWERSELLRFHEEMSRSKAPNAAMWLSAAELTLLTGLRRGNSPGSSGPMSTSRTSDLPCGVTDSGPGSRPPSPSLLAATARSRCHPGRSVVWPNLGPSRKATGPCSARAGRTPGSSSSSPTVVR